MREVFAAEGPDAVLSPLLREALLARLADGEQSVVLLNRRGYAAAYFCAPAPPRSSARTAASR